MYPCYRHWKKGKEEGINNLLKQEWIMERDFNTDVNPIRWHSGESVQWVEVILYNNSIICFLLLHWHTAANADAGSAQLSVSQILCSKLQWMKPQNIYSCISYILCNKESVVAPKVLTLLPRNWLHKKNFLKKISWKRCCRLGLF